MQVETEEVKKGPRPLSNWAQIASAIVGSIALCGIFYQVTVTKWNAQDAAARQVYMSYSEASLRYPALAWPDYERMKAAHDQTELNNYKTYVGHMLFAYDEIFKINNDPEWRETFYYDLSFHMQYLCEEKDPRYFKSFYPKTREMIARELKAKCK